MDKKTRFHGPDGVHHHASPPESPITQNYLRVLPGIAALPG